MLELLMAFVLLAVLIGLALCTILLPWGLLLSAAILSTLAGFAFGLPCGICYHVVLRRELSRLGKLEARWWWRPHAYHASLDDLGRRRVLPWWFAGAFGFLVVMLGFALTMLAVATSP